MENIFKATTKVSRAQREKLLRQNSKLIWFTGLSGSGKTTLAVHLEARLHALGYYTFLLDGDNMRAGLNKDLSFGAKDREENIRRIGEVSQLFLDAGVVVLSAFISPFHADREKVKGLVGADNYIEIFVDCPLEVCEQRDVKGLYKKARAGNVQNFTGITSPYERPLKPDLVVPTHQLSIEESLDLLQAFLIERIGRK